MAMTMPDPEKMMQQLSTSEVLSRAALMTAGIGAGLFLWRNFHSAPAGVFLVKRGLGVRGAKGMQVGRAMLRLPGQTIQKVCLRPRTLEFDLNCLSKQYLPFRMPVSYTVAPFDALSNEMHAGEPAGDKTPHYSSSDLFRSYAEKMADMDDATFKETVMGVVHGETRVQAANMDIDAINDDRELFRTNVVNRVQGALLTLGVRVTNANIAELREDQRADGAVGYLQARERKKLSSAVQQSEVDVAEAMREGEIGKMERQRDMKIRLAALQAEIKCKQMEAQAIEIKAEADLAERKAEAMRRMEIAAIEAQNARDLREQELLKKLELARNEQNLEANRARELTSMRVQAECALRKAEGERDAAITAASGVADSMRLVAKAEQEKGEALARAKQADLEAQANGTRAMLVARADGSKVQALALLAELEAKAKGEQAMLAARADGARQMVEACNGDTQLLVQMLAVHNGIPQAAFEQAAKAVQGLQPQLFAISGDNLGGQIAQVVGGMTPVVEAFQKMWSPAATKDNGPKRLPNKA